MRGVCKSLTIAQLLLSYHSKCIISKVKSLNLKVGLKVKVKSFYLHTRTCYSSPVFMLLLSLTSQTIILVSEVVLNYLLMGIQSSIFHFLEMRLFFNFVVIFINY